MGKHGAAIVIASALLATACGGSKSSTTPGTAATHPGGTVPTSTTLRAPATSTTTVTTPSYSFDDSVPPPKLINTGTNYVAILKSLEAYGNWLAAHHPDPALVGNIVAPGTRQYELFSRDLTRLRANNKRFLEVLRRPSQYTILSARRDAFSADVVEDVISQRTVLPGGHITAEVKYETPTTYRMLVVASQQRWYFASSEVQSAHPIGR